MLLSFAYLLLPLALADDFRPTYHFVPDQNWMNEPNGLIKIGSTWHLFFQHNPTANVWGNLNWGHATSSDLVQWTHEPIAIPSANGIESFTGTAYFDSNNTSGLGTAQNPPYLAWYTGYFPSNGTQDQRLAFSVDDGATWTKYAGNPIISAAQETPHDETGGLETRDPKVFFHAASGNWVMLLAHGGQDKITFWTSKDAIHWTWVSDLTSSGVGLPSSITGWEVPDMFQLPIQGTSDTTWVLIMTPAQGSPAGGNGVLALTGSFDGTTFNPDPVNTSALWLDYGRDFDGAMTWENLPAADGRRILAAISNSYGANPPTTTWKGMLSFPRTLTLQQTGTSRRFLQQPVTELGGVAGPSLASVSNQTLAPGQTLLSSAKGTALDISLAFSVGADAILSLAVRVADSVQTVIRYDSSRLTLSVDRTASGDISYDPAAGGVHNAPLLPDDSGVVRIRVLVDKCSVEVFGGLGEVVISDLIFPPETSDGVSLTVTGGTINLQTAEVRAISL